MYVNQSATTCCAGLSMSNRVILDILLCVRPLTLPMLNPRALQQKGHQVVLILWSISKAAVIRTKSNKEICASRFVDVNWFPVLQLSLSSHYTKDYFFCMKSYDIVKLPWLIKFNLKLANHIIGESQNKDVDKEECCASFLFSLNLSSTVLFISIFLWAQRRSSGENIHSSVILTVLSS